MAITWENVYLNWAIEKYPLARLVTFRRSCNFLSPTWHCYIRPFTSTRDCFSLRTWITWTYKMYNMIIFIIKAICYYFRVRNLSKKLSVSLFLSHMALLHLFLYMHRRLFLSEGMGSMDLQNVCHKAFVRMVIFFQNISKKKSKYWYRQSGMA